MTSSPSGAAAAEAVFGTAHSYARQCVRPSKPRARRRLSSAPLADASPSQRPRWPRFPSRLGHMSLCARAHLARAARAAAPCPRRAVAQPQLLPARDRGATCISRNSFLATSTSAGSNLGSPSRARQWRTFEPVEPLAPFARRSCGRRRCSRGRGASYGTRATPFGARPSVARPPTLTLQAGARWIAQPCDAPPQRSRGTTRTSSTKSAEAAWRPALAATSRPCSPSTTKVSLNTSLASTPSSTPSLTRNG